MMLGQVVILACMLTLVDIGAMGSILSGCILLPLIDKQGFLMSSSEFWWIPGTLSSGDSLRFQGFYWESSWTEMNQEEAFQGTLAGPSFLLNSWRNPCSPTSSSGNPWDSSRNMWLSVKSLFPGFLVASWSSWYIWLDMTHGPSSLHLATYSWRNPQESW